MCGAQKERRTSPPMTAVEDAAGSAPSRGSPGLESEGPLRRLRRLDADALQLEHANLGRRAARRGEAPDLAAGRQDPVAGDDQGHRILGHGLADIARGLVPGPERL